MGTFFLWLVKDVVHERLGLQFSSPPVPYSCTFDPPQTVEKFGFGISYAHTVPSVRIPATIAGSLPPARPLLAKVQLADAQSSETTAKVASLLNRAGDDALKVLKVPEVCKFSAFLSPPSKSCYFFSAINLCDQLVEAPKETKATQSSSLYRYP